MCTNTTRGDPIGSSKLVFVMAPNKDGTSREGDGRYSYVSSYSYFKGKKIDGPIRQGPHADTQANSDLQVLRTAATSLGSLRTAATEFKSAVAASETPADRIWLHWLHWQNQGSVEKEGDVRRARLAFESHNVRGPTRQGPHADMQADSDLQVLRRAATSFDSLRTAATELKAEAAASDSIEDRNERSWTKTTNS